MIRQAVPGDAAALLDLKATLDRETQFMLLEPDERVETPSGLEAEIASVVAQENSTILVADEDYRLVGYVEARGGLYRRNRHCAQVVIGVRRTASGRGIGTALLRELDGWATRVGVRRLELTVMANNERATALYRKCGYETEGTRRRAIRIGTAYIDELFMAKLGG